MNFDMHLLELLPSRAFMSYAELESFKMKILNCYSFNLHTVRCTDIKSIVG